jgi:hypothetical protein
MFSDGGIGEEQGGVPAANLGGVGGTDAGANSGGASLGGAVAAGMGGVSETGGAAGGALPLGGCEGALQFNDGALEAAVRSAIAVPTGPIASSAIAGLTNLSAYGVASMGGIECLSELTNLELPYGTLADVAPLASLSKLISVDLTGNSIEDILPLSGLAGVQTLYLGGNPGITDYSSLAILQNLRWLDLESNGITDLSTISGIPALEHLDLSYNPISGGVLNALPMLRDLTFSGNATTALPDLSGLNLSYLSFGGTHVADLSPLAGQQLLGLDMQYTLVQDLTPIANMTSLQMLNVGGTVFVGANFYRVKSLTPIATLTGLREVWLDAVEPLTPLSGFSKLETVRLTRYAPPDLTPLSGLAALSSVTLEMPTADLGPLVANGAFAAGDFLTLTNSPGTDTPFDCSSVAADLTTLSARGVALDGDCL